VAWRARGSTSRYHHLQIISRQGRDHHRPPLAVWVVVMGGPESGKLLRWAGCLVAEVIKGQVVRRYNDL